MRGSLPVVWSLVLLCGWSVWTAVRDRLPTPAKAARSPDTFERRGAPVAQGRPAGVDPRLLPN
jgi:hypothetical protein